MPRPLRPRTLRQATERLDTWLDGILDTPALEDLLGPAAD